MVKMINVKLCIFLPQHNLYLVLIFFLPHFPENYMFPLLRREMRHTEGCSMFHLTVCVLHRITNNIVVEKKRGAAAQR